MERNLIDTFTITTDTSSFLVFPRNFSISLQAFRIAQLATCESTNVTFPAWSEIFFLQPFATTPRDHPDSYISVEQYRTQEGCDSEDNRLLIIILATLLGVTVLGGAIGGFLCWRHYRRKEQMLILEQKVVQPRTYRETQILLKLETVGTLKTDF